MNVEEHLLQCVAEEGGEIVQSAMKCTRFAITGAYPNGDINIDKLVQETNDLYGVLELIELHGIPMPKLLDWEQIERKKAKVLYNMSIAAERGTINPVYYGSNSMYKFCHEIYRLRAEGHRVLVGFTKLGFIHEVASRLKYTKRVLKLVGDMGSKERTHALKNSQILLANIAMLDGTDLGDFDSLLFYHVSLGHKLRASTIVSHQAQRARKLSPTLKA